METTVDTFLLKSPGGWMEACEGKSLMPPPPPPAGAPLTSGQDPPVSHAPASAEHLPSLMERSVLYPGPICPLFSPGEPFYACLKPVPWAFLWSSPSLIQQLPVLSGFPEARPPDRPCGMKPGVLPEAMGRCPGRLRLVGLDGSLAGQCGESLQHPPLFSTQSC